MDDALASGLSVINMVSLACEEGVGEGSEGLLSSKRAVCRRVWRQKVFALCQIGYRARSVKFSICILK